jgi:glycosyltransferase involved in cell wall biosynthesis
MKILYLYTEVMGYNLPIFEELVMTYGATVDVVHWNQNKLTPFIPKTSSSDIRFHERSGFSPATLRQFALALSPDLVYVSGWQDRGYMPALKALKSSGAKIVMGLDSQWTGSLRHRVGAKLIEWFYKPQCVDYAWVPGPMQYAYASRIGFSKNQIISHLLTANTKVFGAAAEALGSNKAVHYPRRFLYVGRFTSQKGVDTLVDAYGIYKKTYKGKWDLTCIGTGPAEGLLRASPSINVQPYMSQIELANQARFSGAFVLPSRHEPWGVVVHEFASAGLPMVLSDQIGARPQFLVDNLNGFTFANGSADDLAMKMSMISSLSDAKLLDMGQISCQLSGALDPSIVAASFVSVLS